MITYGHEKFIEEAITGVLAQECDFQIELLIVNDCSPDKTHDIVMRILKSHQKAILIRYIKNKMNLGIMPNSIFALNQCKGQYSALCEGDDYWIDPLKLQKQVNILEANSEVMSCHTDVNNVNADGVFSDNKLKIWNYKNNILDIKSSIFYPVAFSCSAVFRNIKLADKLSLHIVSGDWMLWVLLTLKGKSYSLTKKWWFIEQVLEYLLILFRRILSIVAECY
jgi:glycosyltransferase involved in cell wall biosynthesis